MTQSKKTLSNTRSSRFDQKGLSHPHLHESEKLSSVEQSDAPEEEDPSASVSPVKQQQQREQKGGTPFKGDGHPAIIDAAGIDLCSESQPTSKGNHHNRRDTKGFILSADILDSAEHSDQEISNVAARRRSAEVNDIMSADSPRENDEVEVLQTTNKSLDKRNSSNGQKGASG